MKNKHIHDDPKIDCPACVDWIKMPMPKTRVVPLPQTKAEKMMEKTMQRVIDSMWADIKGKKILRTPFGVLVWTPKTKKT